MSAAVTPVAGVQDSRDGAVSGTARLGSVDVSRGLAVVGSIAQPTETVGARAFRPGTPGS